MSLSCLNFSPNKNGHTHYQVSSFLREGRISHVPTHRLTATQSLSVNRNRPTKILKKDHGAYGLISGISCSLESLVFKVLAALCCLWFVVGIDVKASYLPDSPLNWKNLKVSNHDVTTFSILRDKDGLMWFGTNDGLFFYEGEESHRIEIPELRAAQIFALCQYGEEILLGTNNGLLCFKPKGNVLSRPYKDTPSEIRCLLLNGDELWIGSLHGLFLLELKNGLIEDFSNDLPNKSVYSILRDSRGILYIGTYDGLVRFEAN